MKTALIVIFTSLLTAALTVAIGIFVITHGTWTAEVDPSQIEFEFASEFPTSFPSEDIGIDVDDPEDGDF